MWQLEPDQIKARLAWAKAARSGKYPQGHGGLRTMRGRFCFLGVAEAEGLATKSSSGEALNAQEALARFGMPTATSGEEIISQVDLIEANDGLQSACFEANLGRFTFDELADLLEYETWS